MKSPPSVLTRAAKCGIKFRYIESAKEPFQVTVGQPPNQVTITRKSGLAIGSVIQDLVQKAEQAVTELSTRK